MTIAATHLQSLDEKLVYIGQLVAASAQAGGKRLTKDELFSILSAVTAGRSNLAEAVKAWNAEVLEASPPAGSA